MKRKRNLGGGMFRWLNEYLYSNPSDLSTEFFQDNPEYFGCYHEGYLSQTAKWPVQPLDIIEREIRSRLSCGKVADLGCGSGTLHEKLSDLPDLKVFSYDLVSSKPFIKACNIADLPLKDRRVHCAVFCLSLMSTDHVRMIQEAHRVLRRKGVLMIAEVKTRIPSEDKFIAQMGNLGFSLEQKEIPNDYFVFYLFKKIKPQGDVPSSLFTPCKYKKR